MVDRKTDHPTPMAFAFAANESPWTESPAEAKECDRTVVKPIRRRPRAKPSEELVQHVLAEMRKACRELDPPCNGPRDTPGNRDLLAKLHYAEMATEEQWTTVIRRQFASVRDDRSLHKFLSLSTLTVSRNFSRLLDANSGTGTASGRSKPWSPSTFDPEET